MSARRLTTKSGAALRRNELPALDQVRAAKAALISGRGNFTLAKNRVTIAPPLSEENIDVLLKVLDAVLEDRSILADYWQLNGRAKGTTPAVDMMKLYATIIMMTAQTGGKLTVDLIDKVATETGLTIGQIRDVHKQMQKLR